MSDINDLDVEEPALAPFLSLIEKDIQQNPFQLAPMESDFLATVIAIFGSWENLASFDPNSFEFTKEDAAQLSALFAEIDAEEAQ